MPKNKQQPYKASQNSNSSGRPSALRSALAIGLGVLSVPAAGIAFLVTCASNSSFHDGADFDIWPWIWGAMAGAAVGVPMIYLMLRLRR